MKLGPRKVVGVAAFAALLFAAPPARAETALTALDDARACAAFPGGYAVATGGGLAALDGGKRHVLTALDGLPETRVHAVVATATGLWVGTESGAALVDRATWKVTRTVPLPAVHAVYANATATYFGTWGEGVYRLDGAKIANPTPGKRVNAIAEYRNSVYVAFADGPVARIENDALHAIPGSPTHGQSLAAHGSDLVLGDLDGLHHVVAASVGPAFASVDARALAFDGDRLLAATYGTGLLAGSALRTEPKLPRFVRGVGVSGVHRCAATTEGLYVDEGSGWHAQLMSERGIPSNDVTALAADGDRVAIATFDHGAAIADHGTTRAVAGLAADETVNAAVWQTHDRLWLGTAHGLVLADRAGAIVRRMLPGAVVRALVVEGPERVIAGTEDGAFVIEGDVATPLAPPTRKSDLASPMHATWALASAPDGTLYIGTMLGLYWGKNGKYQRASVAAGELADDWITALALHGSEILVGTYSGGVTRLDPVTRKATQLGGSYINPNGLAVRDGKVFAATMAGLLTWDGAAWKNAGMGLGRDVTGIAFTSSETWVSTRRGISISSLRE